jgi:hypothetical protein
VQAHSALPALLLLLPIPKRRPISLRLQLRAIDAD